MLAHAVGLRLVLNMIFMRASALCWVGSGYLKSPGVLKLASGTVASTEKLLANRQMDKRKIYLDAFLSEEQELS